MSATTPPAILITGGARRIGAALALDLAQHGYDIALHCHRSTKEAEAVKARIEPLGRRCEIFPHDLQETAALPQLMRRTHQAFPALCALVNNASVFERAGFLESDEALLDRQFAVNCKAPMLLTHAFATQVQEGQVINLLDTNITKPAGSHFYYLLSKKTLAEFTRMAALQLGPRIRVNAVCPGSVLPSNQNDADYEEKLVRTNPLQSIATVPDVCDAVRFLLDAPRITGQFIFVDGGQQLTWK